MRTGTFEREFTEVENWWVPRGFSKSLKAYVYPNQGWSWTEWKREITDTYETLEGAKSVISTGYLKDMIKTQKIVDIVFVNVVRTRKIAEHKTVVAYDKAGKPVTKDDGVVTKGVSLVNDGDYLLFSRTGDVSMPGLYGYVRAVQSDEAFITIINGAWTMTVQEVDGKLFALPFEDEEDKAPVELIIHHIGIPDPNHRADDYTHQMKVLGKFTEAA